ncbi:MAG: FtsX-like permease family protein [Muribaculaceae bacterium]|nr:FtsX-like permease family protein [Muribaculaceae bacterium]
MNTSLYIARRLSFGREGRSSTPAVKAAVTAIALSVAVMLASLSIVSGFKREITEKITGFNSDILLSADPSVSRDMELSDNLLHLTPALEKILDDSPDVTQYALQTSIPAILKTPDDFKGIYLKGVVDTAQARFLRRNMVEGRLPSFSSEADADKVVLSRLAATQLGLRAGDAVDTYFITDDVRVRRLKIAGIYDSHFEAYDDVLAFADVDVINRLADLGPDTGSSLQITVSDFSRLDEITDSLRLSLFRGIERGELPAVYRLDNARSSGAGYFRWLSLLDMNVIVILSLMTAVGCITLVSGMLIMILDKRRFIGLMKAMGMRTSRLRRVFVYLAVRVTVRGLLIGNAVGLGLLWLQERTHFLRLDADSYYIDFVPVAIHWEDVVLLNAGVILIVYLVMILPSRFVARISPAETMRSE